MAKYIIRLDDACPQMHLANWAKIEKLLDDYQLAPIVAVIPNNKDETLFYDNDENFWTNTISRWQSKNWNLALHGYEHLYTVSTKQSLVPFKNKSEFTGFNYENQKLKILEGLQIFTKNRIYPNCFIAPGHAFDEITIKVLNENTNIKYISDGIALNLFKYLNINWIPQQIWSFKNIFFGIITICLHPNTMKENDFVKMEKWLLKNSKNVININSLLNKEYKPKTILDKVFENIFWLIYKFKK